MARYRRGLGLYLEVVDHSTGKRRVYASRSPVMNFMQFLAGLLVPKIMGFQTSKAINIHLYNDVVVARVVNTAGSSVDLPYTNATWSFFSQIVFAPLSVTAPFGDNSYGIVAGFGTTPVTPSDYKLESPYAEGDGSGRLRYGSTTVDGPIVMGNRIVVRVLRSLTNNHTESQVIRELGLIARYNMSISPDRTIDQRFLIVRDVLPSPITIDPQSTITVAYVFQSVI